MEAHADALEYDLMTMTGRTLSEYEQMGARGYGALAHFVERVPIDSELWREMHGDAEYPRVWSSSIKQAELLADVVDMLALVAHLTAQSHSKHRLKRPKPMQRPWVKDGTRRIGRGAIPAAKFDKWWETKAGERRGRCQEA